MLSNSYLSSLIGRETIAVEMVCHGNICRSPMAAAMLDGKAQSIEVPRFVVTSSGTSAFHSGEGPHPLSQKTWENHGFSYSHTSKQFKKSSFDSVDIFLTADQTNRAMILNQCRTEADREKVFLLRQFDPALSHIDPFGRDADSLIVPDPWGYEIDAYEDVYAQIERALDGLIALFTKEQ